MSKEPKHISLHIYCVIRLLRSRNTKSCKWDSFTISADLEDEYDTLFGLIIDVTDSLTPSNSINLEVGVYVEGVNSAAPVFTHGDQTVTIPESFVNGGKVAMVSSKLYFCIL